MHMTGFNGRLCRLIPEHVVEEFKGYDHIECGVLNNTHENCHLLGNKYQSHI